LALAFSRKATGSVGGIVRFEIQLFVKKSPPAKAGFRIAIPGLSTVSKFGHTRKMSRLEPLALRAFRNYVDSVNSRT